MKASETRLGELLQGGKQFQIPLFQRPYSWNEQNWETLWEDLMSLYRAEVQGSYFLGPIVTQSGSSEPIGVPKYIVIDGQQRLTTLTILLAALRSYLSKIGNSTSTKSPMPKEKAQEMAAELYELYLINKFKKGDDVYKVLPTQDDREAYKKIIELGKESLKKEDKGKIYDAYKFFDNKIKNTDQDDDKLLDLERFKDIILERLLLVSITSDHTENPYLIFESLNYKGEDLSQADLVRNYIFMQLPDEQQDEIYSDVWLPLQKEFKESIGEKEYAEELTNAFWFYLRKDGEAVNQKEVYIAIKERFGKAKKSDGISIENQLKELVKFAKFYKKLNFPEKETEKRLFIWFERLRRLDFKTCHIFLLNVYDKYEEKNLTIEQFEQILIYLVSYFVRRWFAGASTKSLGNVFNNLSLQVKNKNDADWVDGLHQVLTSYDNKSKQVWPDDDTFRKAIITESVYSNSSIDRLKLVLECMEEYLCKHKKPVLALVNIDKTITIEHIMPQKLTKQWESMLGSNFKSVHKQWCHTLGNLTLTANNSDLSTKLFADKLNIIEQCNLRLNKYFKEENVTVWNEDAIKERAEYLADLAIKVWPR
ncbi:DUF262 domain-containing protein [Aerosakkonema funiforme]|uniref:DUF262 domain-containing protein n=1 Tax=Aerosakkonema funiforme TaxID=1246630 RepID=UPI0035BA8693